MTTAIPPPSALWMNWKSLKGVYNATATAAPADLRGKWVLISGANNGIGREAAIQFAKSGANVILACRQPPSHETHPEKVVEECKAAAGEHGKEQTIEWWESDMSHLSSVEALAQRWNDTGRALDILANNAGMTEVGRVVLTKDGFEILHQVNFLSHTLLTLSLLPSIAKAPSPRIICTTSCMHYLGVYDLSNANSGFRAYPNNKLYFQIWLTELQLRLLRNPKYDHIVVHGIHPGYVQTAIFRPVTESSSIAKDIAVGLWVLSSLVKWFGITPQQGSLAIFNAATAPELGLRPNSEDEFKGGAKYFNRIWEGDPSPYTRNAVARKGVWDFVVQELDSSGKFSVPDEIKKEVVA